MPKTGGRQVLIGLGIEATAGTAVAETIFLPWTGIVYRPYPKRSYLTPRGDYATWLQIP